MDKKIGVFICTGCGIGEALDAEKLSKVATRDLKAAVCKTHGFLCGAEGVDLIKKDIEDQGINTVVVAACSPRVNYDVFNFGPSVIAERVNLREQVVWSHPANDEDTQIMAEDYLLMAGAKIKAMELPEPYQVENPSKAVLVVGGGLTGMAAALEVAKAGYQAVIVEKEATLGGYAGKFYKFAPTKAPYTDLEENPIPALAKEIGENPLIKVYTSAEVEQIAGGPGKFDVTIKGGGSERVGAIILATGATPYDPAKVENLGFGKYADVITHAQFEEIAAKGKITRPSDGKEVQRVAFIQCVGSRDENHLPYCSAACCVETLKHATYLKELNPDAQAYVFYKDIRTPGKFEHFYKKVQADGTVFLKADVAGVGEMGGKLLVEATEAVTGDKVVMEGIDLVVLANGMVPSYSETKQPGMEEGKTILNLAYRQGPELPLLKYGFPDSHFICFPYETRRTGIYTAGSVRAPMHVTSTLEDAAGAACKAIQCVESTARGVAVHPRSGDLSFPEFFMQRCTQCKRCTEECPFGAINEDEKGNPLPEPTRCRRCGTCMGACPERIISFKNYSVNMIGGMIKAVEVPEEDEEKPRILIFACENDAYPALDMAGINRLEYSQWVRIIPVRCLGSLNLIWINDSMSGGWDGVLLMGCKHGDDYQCHFVKGSELAEIRLSKVSETLDRLGLESERCRQVEVSIMDYQEIPKIISDFAERLEELGPNPMKGF
ncbi:MAG: hydrogenase iron-sulfur subunit [Bacillota bacterium]|uniref:hydrogenase iron-sulfur subunit n=1 Tax=Desulforudis sp. DRI-14 TaxID=3459793 RepID=UPI0034952E8F